MLLEKFAVATPPETSPVDFGKAVHTEAQRRGMGRARVTYLIMDGAVWLWDLAEDRFKTAVKTLDLHPAREHLQSVAETLHGAGTQAAQGSLKAMLHGLRHGQEARTVRRLEDLLQTQSERTAEDQKTINREVGYFQDHREHLHYQ